MPPVDTIVRAELAQTKVQIHQMTAALYQGIDALDVAFKSVERIAGILSDQAGDAAIAEELKVLRDARAKILHMRLNLR